MPVSDFGPQSPTSPAQHPAQDDLAYRPTLRSCPNVLGNEFDNGTVGASSAIPATVIC